MCKCRPSRPSTTRASTMRFVLASASCICKLGSQRRVHSPKNDSHMPIYTYAYLSGSCSWPAWPGEIADRQNPRMLLPILQNPDIFSRLQIMSKLDKSSPTHWFVRIKSNLNIIEFKLKQRHASIQLVQQRQCSLA